MDLRPLSVSSMEELPDVKYNCLYLNRNPQCQITIQFKGHVNSKRLSLCLQSVDENVAQEVELVVV